MKKMFNFICETTETKEFKCDIVTSDENQMNLILKMNGKPLNLSNHFIKLFVKSKHGAYRLYSSSFVRIVNHEKGLVQVSIPSGTLIPNSYVGQIEILERGGTGKITCGDFLINSKSGLSDELNMRAYVSESKIETMLELDMYIKDATKRLRAFESKMEVMYGEQEEI